MASGGFAGRPECLARFVVNSASSAGPATLAGRPGTGRRPCKAISDSSTVLTASLLWLLLLRLLLPKSMMKLVRRNDLHLQGTPVEQLVAIAIDELQQPQQLLQMRMLLLEGHIEQDYRDPSPFRVFAISLVDSGTTPEIFIYADNVNDTSRRCFV